MIMTTTNSKNSTAALTPLFAKDYNVYINHTDAGGIVYHANHLVFFENCRRDWFGQLGLNGYFLQTDNGDIQHFVVSQADLQYKRAILLDEVISVRVDKVELKPASMIFHQSIHRHIANSDATGNVNTSSSILSSAKIVIACVQNQVQAEAISTDKSDATAANNAPMRPIRVPQKLRSAIEQAISEQMGSQ
jgi:acyl-CoA thioester hydrolase